MPQGLATCIKGLPRRLKRFWTSILVPTGLNFDVSYVLSYQKTEFIYNCKASNGIYKFLGFELFLEPYRHEFGFVIGEQNSQVRFHSKHDLGDFPVPPAFARVDAGCRASCSSGCRLPGQMLVRLQATELDETLLGSN